MVTSPFDARLPSGWSLRAEAARLAALETAHRGDAPAALGWLGRLAALPAPVPVPPHPERWWPATAAAGLDPWVALFPLGWTASGPLPAEPRWVVADGRKVLVRAAGGQRVLLPADGEWQRLERELADAAGPRFPVRLLAAGGEKLAGMEGVGLGWLVDRPATDREGGARIWTGLVGALGLLGIALLLQTFWRREAESRHWSEQERFYRQAAHDLKTPLATLRALAETLALGRTTGPEQVAGYCRSMIREADQAAGVVDGMLLAARLRGGLVTPAPETVFPAAVLATLLDRLAPRLEGWRRADALPPDLAVRADPAMFARALVNLLENVLRHAAAGRELALEARRLSPGLVEVAVGDRGPGRVAGERIEGAAGTAGSGLGLELTRAILDRHGGELVVEDREGGGLWCRTRWPEGERDG
ncbi:MAG: HAMP domain-containing histidine kinase [Candidatus Riflebacteria bacterium]|nr:HAMP domain-containing histidine kinase [Candidatus Riflebacteria bacterium]